MRSRKLAGAVRSSARLRARSCSAVPDAAPAARQPPAPHRAAERRAAKKFKGDRGQLPRAALHGPAPRSAAAARPEEPPEAPRKSELLEPEEDGALPPQNGADPSARQEAAGRSLGRSQAGGEARASEIEDSCAPPAPDALSGEDESGCPAGDQAPPRGSPLQMDNSVFLDDDSNQPMPVSRFFGNVELMQDPPPAAAPCPSMSRREFRKMHFRAKDDEDGDDGAEL